ncbi:MAG: hypothetical protein ABFS32_20685 [Bacteroidota bacterium]
MKFKPSNVINSPSINDYPEGTSFSAVYDPTTGTISYRPSTSNEALADGSVYVYQWEGHLDVAEILSMNYYPQPMVSMDAHSNPQLMDLK